MEAAREGCDLNTAEGRAHMASNAKPLWLQLPEGALKLQLLAELAKLAQLDPGALSAMWAPAQSAAPSSNAWKRHPATQGQRPPTRNRSVGRAMPASRADHLVRMLLGQPGLWESLSGEEHAMLCELPTPHGELFSWLESQLHEYGAMPWEGLRQALEGLPVEELAMRLMAERGTTGVHPDETALELRDLLDRLLIERIKEQETQAIEASKADPSALQRYQELKSQRLQLTRQLEKSQINGIIQN